MKLRTTFVLSFLHTHTHTHTKYRQVSLHLFVPSNFQIRLVKYDIKLSTFRKPRNTRRSNFSLTHRVRTPEVTNYQPTFNSTRERKSRKLSPVLDRLQIASFFRRILSENVSQCRTGLKARAEAYKIAITPRPQK